MKSRPNGTSNFRRVLTTLAILAAVGAAAAFSFETARQAKAADQPTATLYGDYLSGRHAQVERDLDKAIEFQLQVLKRDPNNMEVQNAAFTMMVMEGRIKDAKPLAVKLASKAPDDTLISTTLLLDDLKAKKYEEVLKRLETVSDKGINAFTLPLLKAWSQAGLKRYDQAFETLKPLSEKAGFKNLVLIHTAAINLVAGRNDAAIKDYEDALGSRDDIPYIAAYMLGALYENKGDKEKAKEVYSEFMEQHPRSHLFEADLKRIERGGKVSLPSYTAVQGAAMGLFDLASSLRQRTSRDVAFAFAQMALYLDPGMTLAKVLLGDMYESENRLERANAVYGSIDSKSPFAWSTQLRHAANLDRLDKLDEANTRLRALAKTRTDDPDPLIQLGDIYRGHERFPEAVQAYDEAVQRITKVENYHWSVFYSRGIALERSKQWKRAEADFLKALDLEPKQPYVLNYLGYSWVDQGVNLDRAQKMIEQAVELRPNDGYIVDSLGWAHYRLGRYPEAVKELERAVELRPEDPVINDHLGDAYWKVGRRLEARFQWLRARSLNPESDVLASIEKKLKEGLTADILKPVPSNG
jgi:tetratricopeptide (TPR) repeat protein